MMDTDMKKLLTSSLVLTLLFSLFFSVASPVFAQSTGTLVDPCPRDSTGTRGGGTPWSRLCTAIQGEDAAGSIIGNVLTIILLAAVILALFFLIWGGIRWITSGGDKAKVETARNTIVAAIIGLIVAFVAFFVVQLLLNIFGLGSVANLSIPRVF